MNVKIGDYEYPSTQTSSEQAQTVCELAMIGKVMAQ